MFGFSENERIEGVSNSFLTWLNELTRYFSESVFSRAVLRTMKINLILQFKIKQVIAKKH